MKINKSKLKKGVNKIKPSKKDVILIGVVVTLIVGACAFSIWKLASGINKVPNTPVSQAPSIVEVEDSSVTLEPSVTDGLPELDWSSITDPREILNNPDMMDALYESGMTDKDIYEGINQILEMMEEEPIELPEFDENGFVVTESKSEAEVAGIDGDAK